jgi:hypothetical protein
MGQTAVVSVTFRVNVVFFIEVKRLQCGRRVMRRQPAAA